MNVVFSGGQLSYYRFALNYVKSSRIRLRYLRMAPQITILRPPNAPGNSSGAGSRSSPVRSLFLPTVMRTACPDIPGLYRALSIAAGIAVAFSPGARTRDARCTFTRSLSFPGTSVGPTRCNKFAIVPHNCRKPRARILRTGPRASSDRNLLSSSRVTTRGEYSGVRPVR